MAILNQLFPSGVVVSLGLDARVLRLTVGLTRSSRQARGKQECVSLGLDPRVLRLTAGLTRSSDLRFTAPSEENK